MEGCQNFKNTLYIYSRQLTFFFIISLQQVTGLSFKILCTLMLNILNLTFFYKISYFIIAVGNHGDMLHYFPILSILKSTHIKYSYISFLMLLQYYLIEEIFKTLRKSIEREQKCKLIGFFFKCTHFDLFFLHKKKHR